MSMDDDIKRIEAIMARLNPRIQRYIQHLLEKEGHTIALSIAANVGTSMIVSSLLLVAQRGGNVENFLKILVDTTGHKYTEATAEMERWAKAERDAMIRGGWDTCRPLH
jgi:hypothetical protein